MIRIKIALALAIFAFGAGSVAAQSRTTPTPQGRTSTAESPVARTDATPIPPETADIAITATVTAKELRFDIVPNPTVEFSGTANRETEWDAVRENLPRALEPGVTYRDFGIRLKIVSRFADIDRIVAEALGEIPATDRLPQDENNAPQKNLQPSPSTQQPNGRSPR